MSKKTTTMFELRNNSIQSNDPKKIEFSIINEEQKEVLKSFNKNILTFVSAPPGSGKTFLSVSMGLKMLFDGKIKHLILSRPCVASEKIGFLPGDVNDKILPYMSPMESIILKYINQEKFLNLKKQRLIQFSPIAFQQGITFEDSFIVLDEAQNTTVDQMRTFLTRIGKNCKLSVIGDPNQKLKKGINGFSYFLNILDGVKDIGIVHMTEEAIVRSKLVKDIENRYNESLNSEKDFDTFKGNDL